jgi:hypothetical protein
MPLRHIFILSSEEASTQKRCEKLTKINKSSVIDEKVETLHMNHFLYELETNLGLSNPSHSPEEAQASGHWSTSNLRSKYLPKFIKYILPSSKN